MAHNATVLIVDDERGVREATRMLLKDQYHVVLAVNGHDALAKLASVQPNVVLLDVRMPDMTGIEVLQHIKEQDPYVEVILVTAYATVETARKSLHLGAFDYITKPYNPEELEAIVARALTRHQENIQRSATLEAIERDYQSLCKEVEQAKEQITNHVHETIYALLNSLELRDAYSGQHSMAVLWLVDHFCQYLHIATAERLGIKRAALVHDLGKVGIPEEILNKPGLLNAEERQTMEQHPVLSADIINNVQALADLAHIVRAHHEYWDGHGYPDQLRGDEIPWQAQILAICDTVHAMSSERCYRTSLSEAVIRQELLEQRGKQFRPDLVDAMLESPFVTEAFLLELRDKQILTRQHIRQVLDESCSSPLPLGG